MYATIMLHILVCPPLLIQCCWVRWCIFSNPVSFHTYQNLFRVEGPILMVCQSTLPAHTLCSPHHLGQHIYLITHQYRTLRSKDAVHLQQDINNITPGKITTKFRQKVQNDCSNNQSTFFASMSQNSNFTEIPN